MDYCNQVVYKDSSGSSPIKILTTDNDFHYIKREKACLLSSKSHWNFSSGFMVMSRDNLDKPSKSGLGADPLIEAIAIDPLTVLKNFGPNRMGKANRIEKEGKALVAAWNKTYGPTSKTPGAQFCLPKSVIFKLGQHSWAPRMSTIYGEERSFMLLEISTFRFCEKFKDARSKGDTTPQKISLSDLEVFLKIASTKVSRSKSDMSNAVGNSRHTTIFEGLSSSQEIQAEHLSSVSFDRWGFRCNLNEFNRLLLSEPMDNAIKDCMRVLQCKNMQPSEIEALSGLPFPPEPSDGPEKKEKKSPTATKKPKKRSPKSKASEAGPKKASKRKSSEPQSASEGKRKGEKKPKLSKKKSSDDEKVMEVNREQDPKPEEGGVKKAPAKDSAEADTSSEVDSYHTDEEEYSGIGTEEEDEEDSAASESEGAEEEEEEEEEDSEEEESDGAASCNGELTVDLSSDEIQQKEQKKPQSSDSTQGPSSPPSKRLRTNTKSRSEKK